MKLVSVSVENYRSIAKASKIHLGQSTILVGPNNEGKSNILRALVTGMNVLTAQRRSAYGPADRNARLVTRRWYDWKKDYPVHLQGKNPNGMSIITFEFQLGPDELTAFQETIKSTLNGTLPLRISLGAKSYKITVHKQGPGSKVLSAKSEGIAAFVANRLDLEYIPAVRTAESARPIVERMVARELMKLEGNDEYNAALNKVAELQAPLLQTLSTTIRETLVKFLPDVREVRVDISQEDRYRALRRACEIVVDDGSPTLLEYKGDGVQSLAALGIMRHASETGARGRNLVIAIEEPESHLHPRAIHEFKEVLLELAEKHQVILTTHNPLFVDRVNIRTNILVNNAKARPARSVEEVRETLGVRAADNLRHAELVLVVEGEEDRGALTALIRYASNRLDAALKSGSLTLDSLGGAGNLPYKLSLLRDSLCLCHCFLDDDDAGRSAFERARVDGLVTHASVHFSSCQGKTEAEIEDLYDPAVYTAVLKNSYGVSLDHPSFKSARKWSERMRDTFKGQGKAWTEVLEADVKHRVADAVSANPGVALLQARRAPFDALVGGLEERLAEISSRRR